MSTVVWEEMSSLPAELLPLTFVDVETTGLNPHYGDRICEVALVHYLGERELARFVSLVNPMRQISPGAAAVNGITAGMVEDAPAFATVADRVALLLNTGITVAHNAAFDLAFLSSELARAGMPIPTPPALDTLALARRNFSFSRNSLGQISTALGIPAGGHRALGDTLTTRAVFQHFVRHFERDGEKATLRRLIRLQGGPVRWPSARQTAEVPLPPELADAVAQGESLTLSYLSPQGILTERLVDPIRVDVQGGEAYLVAFCHLRSEQRTFKVQRIVRWGRGIGGV